MPLSIDKKSSLGKLFLTLFSTLFFVQCSSFLGQYLTFFFLDVGLSIYLFSLFRNKQRFLFLLHPVIVVVLSLGFNGRFEDIGVGYTYMNTYDSFTYSLELSQDRNSFFTIGWDSSYIGVIPFLWLPNFIFPTELSDLTYFYSICLWNLFCGVVFVKIAKQINSISNKRIFLLTIIFVISPMSFEINNSIHRYHILTLGFMLFFISWIDLQNAKRKRKYLSFLVLIFSIIIIAFSKLALLISLLAFVLIEYFLKKNIKLVRSLSSVYLYIGFFLFLFAIFVLGFKILPEKYLFNDFTKGSINAFTQAPVVGYFARILYSILSPFPFLNFSQWDLYGGNTSFVIIHLFSCAILLWLMGSFFLNLKQLLLLKYEDRASVVMILSITLSLSFSAVGHNVYLAPAIPFLSVLWINKKYLCKFVYPLGIIAFAEIVLFIR